MKKLFLSVFLILIISGLFINQVVADVFCEENKVGYLGARRYTITVKGKTDYDKNRIEVQFKNGKIRKVNHRFSYKSSIRRPKVSKFRVYKNGKPLPWKDCPGVY